MVTIVGTPQAGVDLAATLADPDVPLLVGSWSWSRAGTRDGVFSVISGATGESYTPGAADVGMFLRASASYTDAFGPAKTASGTAETIADNDTAVWSVTAEPVRVAEGAESTITVSVGKEFDTDQTITLVVGGHRGERGIISLSSSSLTLHAGDTSLTARVTAVDDSVIEGDDETVVVTASHGGAVGSATVTIEDNDTPTWSVTAEPARVAEGAESTITVSAGKAFAVDQTITLAVGGTAAGSDYLLSSSSLTLHAGGHVGDREGDRGG